MRPLLLAILFIVGLAQWSCTDRCTETRKYKRFTPVTISLAEIRQGVRTETAHELETPGKIYAKGNYLFIKWCSLLLINRRNLLVIFYKKEEG